MNPTTTSPESLKNNNNNKDRLQEKIQKILERSDHTSTKLEHSVAASQNGICDTMKLKDTVNSERDDRGVFIFFVRAPVPAPEKGKNHRISNRKTAAFHWFG